MHYLCFAFLKLSSKLEIFFQTQNFYIWIKEKNTKNCSETRRSIDETSRFYMKLFMSICTRESSSHPAQVFLFAGTSLSFLLDTIDTSGSIFFDVVFFFFFNIETRLKQQISQNTNFFIARIVTQMSEVI